MSEQTDSLLSLLKPYGLETDEGRVYLELLENGVASALVLSRNLKIARTRVYRILDKLERLGLVVMRLHERGSRFEASNPKKISMLVSQKEIEAEKLKQNLPILEEQLLKVGGKDRQKSKVLYYKGLEGLKQVTYNSTKADGELLTMEIQDMNAFFKHEQAEEMRLKFVENKIKIRTLTNATKIDAWTQKATEMVEKYWEIRQIPESQLRIKFEVLIYNDAYVMYRYTDGEIFCVEIYNQELSDMQRQIFEYMWRQANKFKVLNNRGKAVLVKWQGPALSVRFRRWRRSLCSYLRD